MTNETLLTPMGVQEIQEYLAHRYPFLLVDRVINVEPGVSISGYKNLTINEQVFQGHFPQDPIFPGVMIIEAMAQLSGILGFVTMNKKASDSVLYLLAGVDKVRFRRRSVPGDRLDLHAELITKKRDMWKFKTTATVDGQLVASAELICVVSS